MIEIRRLDDRTVGPVPGTWRQAHGLDDHGISRTIVRVCCPACGREAEVHGVHGGHGIGIDGKVFPSLICDSAGCTWHDHVRLQGWTGGNLPNLPPGEVAA